MGLLLLLFARMIKSRGVDEECLKSRVFRDEVLAMNEQEVISLLVGCKSFAMRLAQSGVER